VTRLGEFSPIWRVLSLTRSLKITEVAQIIELLFPMHSTSYVLILTKNGLAQILGDFFYKLIWSPWPKTFFITLITFITQESALK
jgi:hypothetical protein